MAEGSQFLTILSLFSLLCIRHIHPVRSQTGNMDTGRVGKSIAATHQVKIPTLVAGYLSKILFTYEGIVRNH